MSGDGDGYGSNDHGDDCHPIDHGGGYDSNAYGGGSGLNDRGDGHGLDDYVDDSVLNWDQQQVCVDGSGASLLLLATYLKLTVCSVLQCPLSYPMTLQDKMPSYSKTAQCLRWWNAFV